MRRSTCIRLIMVVGLGASAWAHEADQYTVPVGREFADLGAFFSDEMRTLIQRAVDKTNARIRSSLRNGQPTPETARLQSPEVIAFALLFEFPPAIHYVETLELRLGALARKDPYPGLLILHRPTFWIYHHPALLLDVTKLARLGRSSTIMIDGVYLGTDKIVHFAHMGYLYFADYRKGIDRGLSVEQAERESVTVGTNLNPFLSESTFLGMFTTGVWSNADLAADYCGMKFYRNLTEEVRVRGEWQPPMLVRDGVLWKLADHVVRTDFFRVFVSDHWDEALVPNVFGPGIAPFIEAGVEARCDDLLGWYLDPQGRRRSREHFRDTTASLTHYFGEYYGFRGNPDELVTLAGTCFDGPPREPRRNPALSAGGRDAYGRTPLWWAAEAGSLSEVQNLLSQRADVAAADADLETPLHAAARRGHVEIMERLIAAGSPVDARSLQGSTPLHLVAQSRVAGIRRLQAARLLLSHRADARAQDDFGCTPLHDAAAQGDTALVRVLIDGGADLNPPDFHGTTPLHRAARSGRTGVVSLLISKGANSDARNQFGHTPADEARLSNHDNILPLLQNRKSGIGTQQ